MKAIQILIAALVFGSAAHAAEMHDMAAMQPAAAKAAAVHSGEGTVNKVDVAAGKINLTHGPIKSLGWSGMTMDFPVKDKALLSGLKPGQKVAFELEKTPDGRYPITRITPAK